MRRAAWLVWLGLPVIAQTPQRLTLDEAEAIAVKQHPALAGARLSSQAAGEATNEVRSGLYPALSGSVTAVGTADQSRLAAGALNAGTLLDRFASGVALTQLITDFGRTQRLVESSRLRAQSEELGADAVRALVLLEVDRAYFRELRSHGLLRVAEQTVKARQVVADQVAELAKSNLKSALDVSFANVNLAEAKLLLAAAQNEVQAASADLSSAMGYPQTRTFELAETAPAAAPAPDAASLVAEALQHRPDVLSLRLQSDSAVKLALAEKALVYPTVSAAGVAGGAPAHDDRMLGRYGAAGINVSIPVFNGHLFAARRNEAELRAQAVAERVREIEQRVARDVQVAWLNANTAYQRIGLTAQLLEQATLALELAQARYDLGLSSIVELSQAQLNKTSAEIQNLTARYDFQMESAAMRYQTGALR